MKKYVFIGAYDKTDMLIYVAKILSLLGKKVLLIDTTLLKKSRYIVPTMIQEKQYITTFDDVDVAIGFENFKSIEKYQKQILNKEIEYDIILLDIDRAIAYQKFEITKEDTHYFVTSFDLYSLKRGLQVIAHIPDNIKITKIYYTRKMLSEENQYFNFLAKNYKIQWDKNIVFFPLDAEDIDAIFINQRSGHIQMKGLSTTYVDSILFLAEDISGEKNGKVKKAYKSLE